MSEKPPATSKSARTRRRIIDVAAAAYREKGVDGVGVREIMKRAGLTQGGFYSHFGDKEALFREATAETFAAASASFVEEVSETVRQPEAFINKYLSVWHRDHPEEGCFMATLGGEMARESFEERRAFATGASATVKLLEPHMEGATPMERVHKAILLVSSLGGVITQARVMTGTPLSEALLANARAFYIEMFSSRREPPSLA